jgi:cell division protein FtsL
MSNITKTHKVVIFAMFIAAALIGSVVAIGDNTDAFATKKKGNDAEQEIEQGQASEQNAQCVSGDITAISCNNLGFQFQTNEGNLALGQR